MKRQRPQPEPFLLAKDEAGALTKLGTCVAEQRPEQQNLKGHPADDSERRGRVFELRALDPGERALLPAGRRDAKRNWRKGPADDPPGKSDEKDGDGRVRNGRSENQAQSGDLAAGVA